CSEIVDDDYYRTRAQRTRARVNYASWVAYLFGLGALLVFRPVGIVSIGAGLLLSILYYAIPVEPPATKAHPHRRLSFGRRLARQLKLMRAAKLERVELSFRGTTKFSIDGVSFRRLGEEYAKRNFDYVLYTFPRLFRSVGASPPPPAGDDREALLQFHRHWYGEDQLTRSVANGM